MATKKISQLTLATGVTGVDLVPIVQGGVTKRAAISLLGGVGATGPTGSAGSSVTGPTGPAGAGEVYQSETAPGSAATGSTWLDTATGKYFTRYADLWIEVGGKHYT
jgi:hypothetical protein